MRLRTLFTCAVAIWGLPFDSQQANAQTTTQVMEVDPRLAEAQVRQAIAEAEQAEAEARRARIDAALPTSESRGVDGAISVGEGAGYFAEILAYDALDQVADDVAFRVGNEACTVITSTPQSGLPEIRLDCSNTSVLLVDSLDIASQVSLRSIIDLELDEISRGLESLVTATTPAAVTATTPAVPKLGEAQCGGLALYFVDDESNRFLHAEQKMLPPCKTEPDGQAELAPLVALTAIPAVLGAVREISNFFQADVSITNRAFAFGGNALQIEMLGSLKNLGLTVLSPNTVVSGLRRQPDGACDPSKQSSIVCTFTKALKNQRVLLERRDIANAYYNRAKSKRESEIAVLESRLTVTRALRIELLKKGKPYSAIDTDIDAIEGRLETARKTLRDLEFAKMRLIDPLDAVLQESSTLFDLLTTANASGVAPLQTIAAVDRILSLEPPKKGYFLYAGISSQGGEVHTVRRAFSGRLTYLGGTVVSYALFDKDGEFILADNAERVHIETVKRLRPTYDLRRP